VIDIRELRENPEAVRRSQQARGEDVALVEQVLAADAARRTSLAEFERLRASQKDLGKKVAAAAGADKQKLVAQAKSLAAEVRSAQSRAESAQAELDELVWRIPNVVVDGVPVGGEADYQVLKHVGTPRDFEAEGFAPRDHLELGEALAAIDVARGAKVSGARFYFLTGIGARLELALLNFAMDTGVANGFIPMITPTLVRPEVMAGTGFLGAHASEVARAGYHADEILDLSDGPRRYAGWSACYRREAGSYGKDTRGIIRVHQFHKVEMFVYCRPDEAAAEHERLLGFEESVITACELPYRVIDTAAGDLGSSAARKFDCEAWLPTQSRYLELTSTSNCTTFQARRLAVRYRDDDGTPRTAATLNGTLATTRWIVALLENHQQADGSVYVPVALRPYLGGLESLVP
jgi:seryl-tRNA synthetase